MQFALAMTPDFDSRIDVVVCSLAPLWLLAALEPFVTHTEARALQNSPNRQNAVAVNPFTRQYDLLHAVNTIAPREARRIAAELGATAFVLTSTSQSNCVFHCSHSFSNIHFTFIILFIFF